MGMMLTCKEISFLVSKELDNSVPLMTKLKMLMHLSMCQNCATYKEQIVIIDKVLKKYYTDEEVESGEELSEAARERLLKRLRDELQKD